MAIFKRLFFFMGAGVVGFIVDAGVLALLMGSLGPKVARIVSFVAAVFATWIINRQLAFKNLPSNQPLLSEFLNYFLIMLVGGSANLGVYLYLLDISGRVQSHPVLGVAVGSLAGLIINYGASRSFLYRSKGSTPLGLDQPHPFKAVLGHWTPYLANVLPVVIGLLYLAVNWSFSGPVYQQDEIGYLINAAFLSGHVVDGFSSYHAGYSLLLAPLFALLHDPGVIYKGVLVVNAIGWGLTLFILGRCLRAFSVRERELGLTLIIMAAYPTWMGASGFAFSQGAFTLVYLLALWFFLRWLKHDRLGDFIVYSCLTGYLFWIHPTGIGVIAAAFIAVMYQAIKTHRVSLFFLHTLILVLFVGAYKGLIEPWMMATMTPEGFAPRGHYPSFEEILQKANGYRFSRDWILAVLGQFLYLTVASFGLFLVGLYGVIGWLVGGFWKPFKPSSSTMGEKAPVAFFLIGSCLAIMGVAALNFALQEHGPITLDEWFYGRYVEAVMLPIMALGVALEGYRMGLRSFVFFVLLALGVAWWIQTITTSIAINPINMLAFWPSKVTDALRLHGSPTLWFGLGGLSCLWLLVPRTRGEYALILLVWAFSSRSNLLWHRNLMEGYGKPSDLVALVQRTVDKGACVGFDPALPKGANGRMFERIRFYSFYLFNYDYRRITPEDWASHCEGPLFSFGDEAGRFPGVLLVGKEQDTGLKLWSHPHVDR